MSQQPIKWIRIIFSTVLNEFIAITHHITYSGSIFVFLDCCNCLIINVILTSLSYTNINTLHHQFYYFYQIAKNILQLSLPDNFDHCKEIIDACDDKMRKLISNCDNVKCFHVNQSLSGGSGTTSVLGASEIIEFERVQILVCHVISCDDSRTQAMKEFFSQIGSIPNCVNG